jgi:hypothetical protein
VQRTHRGGRARASPLLGGARRHLVGAERREEAPGRILVARRRLAWSKAAREGQRVGRREEGRELGADGMREDGGNGREREGGVEVWGVRGASYNTLRGWTQPG